MFWVGTDSLFKSVMLWAASLTTFFIFCHSGEITVESEGQYDHNIHLSFGNVAFNNASDPTMNSLNIKQIKEG